MATQEAMMEEMLEPIAEALTRESARLFSRLQAKPEMQARIDQLSSKCNEGELTAEEREEYEDYIRIGNLFTLIKAKAKRVGATCNHN